MVARSRRVFSAGEKGLDVGFQGAVASLDPGAIVVQQHVGALLTDVEQVPDFAIDVRDMGERSSGCVLNELCHRADVVGQAGNTKEGDFVTVRLLDLRDRGAFSSSKRSPGCPEPEHGVLAFKRGQIELGVAERGKGTDQLGLSGRGSGFRWA